jgi:ectoine hydroxylase-related dioxygenase (phytanoyl-CoA dioxygenase family)
MDALSSRMLSFAEIEAYKREGWMRYGAILSAAETAELRSHVDDLVANLPPGKRPEDFDMIHTWDSTMMSVCQHSRVLDLIEQFVGPDIVLFASHLICKPGGDGKAAPWHQDSTYWPLEPMEVMTMWLAIDPATPENGCMRVIPRTHTLGELAHDQQDTTGNLLHLGLDVSAFADRLIVDCVLEPGECTLHEARLVHGSSRNTSPMRRAGYTMRFMPATTRLRRDPGFYESHPLYLLRGADEALANTYVNA